MTSTYVVIVNYRTGPLVVDCLASLVSELPALRGGRVIVVDNASGDDSVACIGAAIEANGWGGWAEVVALPRNGGFAYGNNRAIERVREHDPAFGVVVCLNPDAAVRPGALEALGQQLESRSDAGIAGASIEDEHGMPQRSAHMFPTPLSEFDGAARLGVLSRLIAPGASPSVAIDAPRRCDWVSGACFAIRRQVLDSIGPLDEGYFLYFEETDFCLRARQSGWSCWFVPNARVVHREGSSTGIRDRTRRRPAYWFASRRRFLIKAHGVAGLAGADLLWALGHASLVLRRAIGLGRGNRYAKDPARFARDLLIGDARAILRGEASAILSGTLREAGSVSKGNA